MGELPTSTADAYSLAIGAVRAALAAPSGQEAPAGRAAVGAVDDVELLRRTVGALAFLAAKAIPRAARRGRSVATALDGYVAEITWRAS